MLHESDCKPLKDGADFEQPPLRVLDKTVATEFLNCLAPIFGSFHKWAEKALKYHSWQS